ncbi:hypothetical protein KC19_4G030500 [Ceratodon purpureus]|uniref:LysM domain-containing protein n=1 Tax=Ceratodon purpureus TaxID=3225 RepID=A0A8T0I4W9_CERPU|nr:hypothetical protein KC19_4G030500 [Ceratodon purpureus]
MDCNLIWPKQEAPYTRLGTGQNSHACVQIGVVNSANISNGRFWGLKWVGSNSILAAVLMWAAAMTPMAAMAQQQYNNSEGYICNGASETCSTYGLYRTFQAGESLDKVAFYFNVSADLIANASELDSQYLSQRYTLARQQAVYIPLDCRCQNMTSQMLVPMTIITADTLWLISITIFGGMTKYQAMTAFNPTIDILNLMIGDTIQVPVFCACPTASQIADGVQFLLTHTVYPGESLDDISGYYGITVAALSAANKLATNVYLGVNTTVLVPLSTLPPLSSIKFIPPPPESSPSSSPTSTPRPPPPESSPSSSPTSTPRPAFEVNHATGKSKDLGLIVGLSLGSFLVLIVLAFGVYLFKRRRRAQNVKASDKEGLAEVAGLPGFISYKHLSTATKQSLEAKPTFLIPQNSK